MSSSQTIAVNLGSGLQIAPGWYNFDNSPNLRLSKIPYARWILWKLGMLSKQHYDVKWPAELIWRELTRPLPFRNDTVDYVYTSHFLEHIQLSDTQKLLKDIYRVLKIGGVVRVIVPDLQYYINQYIVNNKENPGEAGDIFMKGMNVHSNQRDPHLWMYDTASMCKHMRNAGFSKLTVHSFKEGLCKNIDILDNRPQDSLFIEGIK